MKDLVKNALKNPVACVLPMHCPLLAPLLALLLGLLCTPALGAQDRNKDLELLRRAEQALSEADASSTTDEATARGLREEAIAIYQHLIEEGHASNHRIHRNLGTAYMRDGDLGHAIASFRRAQELAPNDPFVSDSLAAARAQVRTEIDRKRSTLDAVLWWRGIIPRPLLLALGAAAWVCLWALLIVRLASGRGKYVPIAFGCGVVAFLCLGSIGLEAWTLAHSREVVVVSDEVVGRRGPSDKAYDATFEQPIRAGVEADLLETRDGWARTRLPSGEQTWLPLDAVVEI